MKRLLSDILEGVPFYGQAENIFVNHLCYDSQTVKEGDLFFAYPGYTVDSRKYISQAKANGARMIIYEAEGAEQFEIDTDYIAIKNLSKHLGRIAANYFDNPSKKLSLIGVTGTNGKTSVCHFYAQVMEKLNQPSAILGTLGNGSLSHLEPSNLTTLHPVDLHAWLAKFAKENIKQVAMEVSSIGIAIDRVNGVNFTQGVFTNFSRDHIDFHVSMKSYADEKKKLFFQFLPGISVINIDDALGLEIASELYASFQSETKVIAYSLQRPQENISFPVVWLEQIQNTNTGFIAQVLSPWGEGTLKCNLFGLFNVQNCLCVLISACESGYNFDDVLKAISYITPVPGRMNIISHENAPSVVVDYAHTPDALKNALVAVSSHTTGDIWCVFGCGGDRDRGKRPEMAKCAEQLANKLILTDDNPRFESPEQIFHDILSGFESPVNVICEHDRKQAIKYAISQAKAEDVILIAGKGHEPYQEICGQRYPFDDREIVQEAIKKRSPEDGRKPESGFS